MNKLLKPLKEVEQVIGVRRSKLYQLFADGTLETVTIGRRRFVPRSFSSNSWLGCGRSSIADGMDDDVAARGPRWPGAATAADSCSQHGPEAVGRGRPPPVCADDLGERREPTWDGAMVRRIATRDAEPPRDGRTPEPSPSDP